MTQTPEQLARLAYETMMQRVEDTSGWPEGVERLTWDTEAPMCKEDWRCVVKALLSAMA